MERVELLEALESGDLRLPLSGVFAVAKKNLRGLIEAAECVRNPRPTVAASVLHAFAVEDDEDEEIEEDEYDDDLEYDEDWADDDEDVDADEMIFHRSFLDAVMDT